MTKTTYQLSVIEDDLRDSIFEKITTDGNIDFDKIEKTPESFFFNDEDITPEIKKALNDIGGFSSSMDLVFEIKDKEKRRKATKYVHNYFGNQRDYGHGIIDEYDWREKYWGSYNTPKTLSPLVKNTLYFEWYGEFKNILWEKLSKKFPDVTFEIKFADERYGWYAGIFTINNGEIKEILKHKTYQDSGEPTPEHNKLFASLCYPEDTPEELGFDENWEKIDE